MAVKALDEPEVREENSVAAASVAPAPLVAPLLAAVADFFAFCAWARVSAKLLAAVLLELEETYCEMRLESMDEVAELMVIISLRRNGFPPCHANPVP
jgi:hypothetical protein